MSNTALPGFIEPAMHSCSNGSIVGVVFSYQDAFSILSNSFFPIICVDIPRANLCLSVQDAYKFYYTELGITGISGSTF